MAGEPTAQLETLASITAVTSARKLLRVTYSVGDSCLDLSVASPAADVCDSDCPFGTLHQYQQNITIAVSVDGSGHYSCDWTDFLKIVRPSTQTLVVDGLASVAGQTGGDSLNGSWPIDLSTMGLDSNDVCAFNGTTGGWHTITSWTFGPPGMQVTFPVQVMIGGEPNWNVTINLFGGQSAAAYLLSGNLSPCDFADQIPLTLSTSGGYDGWIDWSNASFRLEPSYEVVRIQPVFDEDNVLTHVSVKVSYDNWETESAGDPWYPEETATCAALADGVFFDSIYGGATITSANKISLSSIGTGDIRVTGPLGYDEVATFVSADQAVDASAITATYSIPPPENNIWCWPTNGTYIVSLIASQVADLAGSYVAAGTLGTFLCSITGESILVPLRLGGYLVAEVETLRFSMRLADNSGFDDDATPTVLILTTAGTLVAPTSGPVNMGGGYYSVTVTQAVHFPGPGELRLQAQAAGCQLVDEPYWSGPVPADQQAVDGDQTAAEYNRRDLTIGYSHGEVVEDTDAYEGGDYGDYGYATGCTPAITVFCVYGLKLRETSTEVGTTGLYTLGYARRYLRLEYEPAEGETVGESRMVIVLKSQTVGDYTQITVDRADLPVAPPAGTKVTIGGYSAPEQAEA